LEYSTRDGDCYKPTAKHMHDAGSMAVRPPRADDGFDTAIENPRSATNNPTAPYFYRHHNAEKSYDISLTSSRTDSTFRGLQV